MCLNLRNSALPFHNSRRFIQMRLTTAVPQFTHSPARRLPARSLQPDTFKRWSLLRIEIARHGWSWEEFRRTDESFVFLLIDADTLSCLLLPHLAELRPSNWHVASLRYADRHWCVHSLSLCIFPLLCLPLIWFPLTRVSAVRVPRCSSVLF